MPPNLDSRLAEFAACNHGVFSTEHARLIGFSDELIKYRLKSGRWIDLHLNAYRLAGVPPTWRGALLAACWAGGHRAVASHRSAAALWGLPGGRTDLAEITCPRWRRARHIGVTVHETNELSSVDIAMVDGIAVTSPERTLLGLAAVAGDRTVELALDAAERRELVTPASMRSTILRLSKPGRRGVRRLRRILDLHDPQQGLSESEAETLLVRVLRANGLPKPTLQHSIYSGKRFVARVDAAFVELKIAIEYDSYEHHTGRLALVRDSARRNQLVALGWAPITATAADLRSGGLELAAAIRAAARLAS